MSSFSKFSILIVLGLLCYGYALGGSFLWDDYYLIVENDAIKSLEGISESFRAELLLGSNYYRPLQALSFYIDYKLWKLNPFGFHITNFLLHLLVAILLYRMTYLLSRDKSLSYISTFLFFIHPLHTEVVSYISGRADSLMAIFILSSFILFIKHRVSFSLFLFLLSILCKESAIIYPLILFPYAGFFEEKDQRRKLHFSASMFAIISLIYLLMRQTILNFHNTPLLYQKNIFSLDVGLYSRILSFLKSLGIYINLLFLPQGLHMQRYLVSPRSFWEPKILLFLLIALFFIFIFKRIMEQSRKLVLFSLFWFFIFLLPQSSLVFPKILAEHFLYLPSMGFFIIFTIFLLLLKERFKNKKVPIVIILSLIIFYSTLTFSQNINYREPIRFYRWILKHSPLSFKIHNMLAIHYEYIGRKDLALEHFRKALEMISQPQDFYGVSIATKTKLSSDMHYNLGVLFAKKRFYDIAEHHYQKAIELKKNLIQAYNNLGTIYIREKRYKKAEEVLRDGLAVNKEFAPLYYNLGLIYALREEYEKAVSFWEEALKINPDYQMAKEARQRIISLMSQ